MSRIGYKPIEIPAGVKAIIEKDKLIIKGVKGELESPIPQGITAKCENNILRFGRDSDIKQIKALHGLTRALAMNSIIGVTEGFSRKMEIVGVGYKISVEGKTAVFSLGYAHPIIYHIPEGIEIEVNASDKNPENIPRANFIVKSIDKHLLGDFVSKIRKLRKPEPYKGKGIRYSDEKLIRKAGKSGAK
ncbi:MAG: 50S ribosomal protein L6 [Candidatus Coatesbacteria bacterium]|nr:50S ribosomal protein L6 [Candidatus Coatesbacteria bacterium]